MNFYGIVLAISGSRDVQEFRGTFDFVHRPLTAPSSPRPQNIQRAGRIRVSFDARRVHTHTHTHTRDTPPRVACTGRFTLSDIVFRLAFGLTSERKVMKVCQSSFENVPPRKPLPPRCSFSTRSRGNFSTINDRSLPRNFLTYPSPCSPSLKTRMRKMGIIERERVWDRETRLLFC